MTEDQNQTSDLPSEQPDSSGSSVCSTPLQVNLGRGLVSVTVFTDDHGKGVLMTDTGQEHKVGERDYSPAEPHVPGKGEVLIHCSNRESALVLMEQVCRLVAMFTDEDV